MLRGSVAINTYFMPLVGQPYVTVIAESEVRAAATTSKSPWRSTSPAR